MWCSIPKDKFKFLGGLYLTGEGDLFETGDIKTIWVQFVLKEMYNIQWTYVYLIWIIIMKRQL